MDEVAGISGSSLSIICSSVSPAVNQSIFTPTEVNGGMYLHAMLA